MSGSAFPYSGSVDRRTEAPQFLYGSVRTANGSVQRRTDPTNVGQKNDCFDFILFFKFSSLVGLVGELVLS